MPTEKPLYKEVALFCKAHLGKGCFAPFTETDYRAWYAFVYLCQLYGATGSDQRVIDAMRSTLLVAQNSDAIRRVFRQTIPGALDWGHVREIWPQISNGLDRYDEAIQTCGSAGRRARTKVDTMRSRAVGGYEPDDKEQAELVELWHLSRTALAGTGLDARDHRLQWTLDSFLKAHASEPNVKSKWVYVWLIENIGQLLKGSR